jgi:hypothetical protein
MDGWMDEWMIGGFVLLGLDWIDGLSSCVMPLHQDAW